jgi:dCTP deaminase
MSVKSDRWIRKMASEEGMIEPFEPGQIKEVNGERVVSFGTSSYGYDIRCSGEFKIFTNINSTIVDPKNFDSGSFVDFQGDVCIIPPNSFALARTVEYFRIPRDVLTICLGKSTYARCGIIVNVTPFEPEWEGFVTLEFSNTTPLPAKIYANEGLLKSYFFKLTLMIYVKPLIVTVAVNIKGSPELPYQKYKLLNLLYIFEYFETLSVRYNFLLILDLECL